VRRIKFSQVEWLIVLAVSSCITVRGQIGSGWTEVHPKLQVQLRGTGPFYRTNRGVETFALTNSAKDDDERAEIRVWNDYATDTHQFEGHLKVVNLAGTSINVKQTFLTGSGAWFLCTVDKAMNGTLRDHKDKTILATNVLGRVVRLNTVHDMATGKFYVYVDGVLKETKTSDTHVAYNDKYGSYRSASGYGPITVEWSNVRFWTGGSVDTTSDGPPLADKPAPVETAADTTAPVPAPKEPATTGPDLIVPPPVVEAAPAASTTAPSVPAPVVPEKSDTGSVLAEDEKQFLAQVVTAVKNNDIDWITDHTAYPLSIIASDEISVVKTKEAFKKALARHLTDDVRAGIVHGAGEPYVRNWQGIMVGDESLWFSKYQHNGQTAEFVILSIGHFAFQPHSVPQGR